MRYGLMLVVLVFAGCNRPTAGNTPDSLAKEDLDQAKWEFGKPISVDKKRATIYRLAGHLADRKVSDKMRKDITDYLEDRLDANKELDDPEVTKEIFRALGR